MSSSTDTTGKAGGASIPESVPHWLAAPILAALLETWPTPMWRDALADRLGEVVPRVSAALDEMKFYGLVRVESRKDDLYGLTKAGDYVARIGMVPLSQIPGLTEVSGNRGGS